MISAATATARGNDPALVRSSDEFTPRQEFAPKQTRYTAFALLSLSKTSAIRAIGFTATVYTGIIKAIQREWHEGLEYATLQEGETWTAVLYGTPWKKSGYEELESIRLIVAIFTALAHEGWTMVEGVQAGAGKNDAHSFIFAWSDEVEAKPPTFFALSFPLPDRISIIDSPSIATPSIISSVRSAIETSSTLPLPQPHRALQPSTPSTSAPRSPNQSAISNSRGLKVVTIKDEGWANEGVYSFWIGGYASWFKPGGVKDKRYDNNHPALLLNLLNKLDAEHFGLTTSIPLLPLKKRRDILLFHSLPSAGLLGEPSRGAPNLSRLAGEVGASGISVGRPPPLPRHVMEDHNRFSTQPLPSLPPRPKPSPLSTHAQPPHALLREDGENEGLERRNLSRLEERLSPETMEDALFKQAGGDKGGHGDEQILPIASKFLNQTVHPGGPISEPSTPLYPSPTDLEHQPIDKESTVAGGIYSSAYQGVIPTQLEPKRASSWVLAEHPDVIPGPQPSSDGMVVLVPDRTEPSELEEEGWDERSKEEIGVKKGKLASMLGRKRREVDRKGKTKVMETKEVGDVKRIGVGGTGSGDKMTAESTQQVRSDTTYTEPGLAGVGAFLKTPLAVADPKIHQRMGKQAEGEDGPVGNVDRSVVVGGGGGGSVEASRFHEQFRDTLEVPIDWIGDQHMGKVVK